MIEPQVSTRQALGRMIRSRIARESLEEIAATSGIALSLLQSIEGEPHEQRPSSSAEEEAIARMLELRIARRESLARISKSSGIRLALLVQIARRRDMHYPHRHPSKAKIKQAISAVEQEGLSCSRAARKVGMSKTSVHRYVQRRRIEYTDSAGEFRVHQTETRCPKHGRISVVPCVACAAEAARDARNR